MEEELKKLHSIGTFQKQQKEESIKAAFMKQFTAFVETQGADGVFRCKSSQLSTETRLALIETGFKIKDIVSPVPYEKEDHLVELNRIR